MFSSRSSSTVRKADHAGSWYPAKATELRKELQSYWDGALERLKEDEQPPIKHARVIISPHAGYRYSGPTAGVAFRALDINPGVKNVFVIGPSHHVYLSKASVSTCQELETPLGNLKVNCEICDELLKNTSLFTTVAKDDEEAEHSLEMQYPFLKFALDQVITNPAMQPPVVPIMVGNTNAAIEKQLGTVLAPYLHDPSTLFIISSDFAHWGKRFRYTYYLPTISASPESGISLRSDKDVSGHAIHESIAHVDDLSIKSITTGTYELFAKCIEDTGNTVCGRHPIGVIMCALSVLHKQFRVSESLSKFVFTDYSRSGLVNDVEDSSVSYASAFAKVECMSVIELVRMTHKLLDIQSQNGDADAMYRIPDREELDRLERSAETNVADERHENWRLEADNNDVYDFDDRHQTTSTSGRATLRSEKYGIDHTGPGNQYREVNLYNNWGPRASSWA